jgi:hypothetical protein
MRVNLGILHVVLDGYRTEKASERHSGMLLAGIQGFQRFLAPDFRRGVGI